MSKKKRSIKLDKTRKNRRGSVGGSFFGACNDSISASELNAYGNRTFDWPVSNEPSSKREAVFFVRRAQVAAQFARSVVSRTLIGRRPAVTTAPTNERPPGLGAHAAGDHPLPPSPRWRRPFKEAPVAGVAVQCAARRRPELFGDAGAPPPPPSSVPVLDLPVATPTTAPPPPPRRRHDETDDGAADLPLTTPFDTGAPSALRPRDAMASYHPYSFNYAGHAHHPGHAHYHPVPHVHGARRVATPLSWRSPSPWQVEGY